ncbi:MAG TPA: polysaccharide biosynthesis/export family protein [Gemmatimonadales bacterium]|nr:polysaccharide biosynthesis/export family protein [Gemmatimonadales bacterium]
MRRLGAAVALLLGAGPALAQDGPAGFHAEGLRPGDFVRVAVWREPDLSGEFQVDARGFATFPKLGPVAVATMHPDSIRPALLAAYAEYLVNPSVEVVPLRRVSVLGAVAKPGLYPVDPTMTVADAVALAGGAAADGKREVVELRRGAEVVVAKLDVVTPVSRTPLRSGDQLWVPQKSWLSRNPWIFTSVLAAAATIGAVVIAQ